METENRIGVWTNCYQSAPGRHYISDWPTYAGLTYTTGFATGLPHDMCLNGKPIFEDADNKDLQNVLDSLVWVEDGSLDEIHIFSAYGDLGEELTTAIRESIKREAEKVGYAFAPKFYPRPHEVGGKQHVLFSLLRQSTPQGEFIYEEDIYQDPEKVKWFMNQENLRAKTMCKFEIVPVIGQVLTNNLSQPTIRWAFELNPGYENVFKKLIEAEAELLKAGKIEPGENNLQKIADHAGCKLVQAKHEEIRGRRRVEVTGQYYIVAE